MPSELWDDVKILISDNCSTDETMSLGREYSTKDGVDIIYSRNSTNLGMDGNFVTCFKAADTRYVWLLGDDDTIIIDMLSLIVKELKKEEIGVLHLSQTNMSGDDERYIHDTDRFLRNIGIYITFISANIVNTKYVKEIDFEKYLGSFFTLIPLYLTAMIKERNNLMINKPVFEGGKDAKRNGGYGICTVFVDNYLGIFHEFVEQDMLSEDLYNYEKDIALSFVAGFVVRYYIFKEESNFKPENTWDILCNHYPKWKLGIVIGKRILQYLKHRIL